jgi:hypothetical protein
VWTLYVSTLQKSASAVITGEVDPDQGSLLDRPASVVAHLQWHGLFSCELGSLNERVDDGASHLPCRRSSVRAIKG